MATATIFIDGVLTGTASGNQYVRPAALSLASPVGQRQIVNLSSGANTITLPSGTRFVHIQPPAGNAQTITLKGVSGDTGVALHKTNWTALSLESGVTSLVLTAGGSVTAVEITCW